jgi:hypothetical protein
MNNGTSRREETRKNNSAMMGGRRSKKTRKGGRKPSKWNLFVKKIYMDMKKKMGKKASFKMALKEASRRKKDM